MSQGVSKLIWEDLLIHTMQEVNSTDNPELDTLSSRTMLQLLGCPRSKKLLKLQCLEQIFCDGYWNGNTPSISIQAAHDGNVNKGTVFGLWGQYVSYSQETATIVHIEQKVEFNLLLCDQGIFGNEGKSGRACAISGQPVRHMYESCSRRGKSEATY